MDETILFFLGLIAVGAVGWALGWRMGGGRRSRELLAGLARELSAGRAPTVEAGSPAGLAEVRQALEGQWTSRNAEREQALREALGRIAAFLREEIRHPLEVARQDPGKARDGVERALGALDDLEFFLREPLTPDEVHDLTPVVREVTHEFTKDWEIAVRFQAEDRPVRAHIHRGFFMDAVYLLLHNAGQFGGGQTVDVRVTAERGRAVVTIRDRGKGFSEEALERAHDLFYTTTPSGLGLGIPFARSIVESFGGDLTLQNGAQGGAEVRMSLPSA